MNRSPKSALNSKKLVLKIAEFASDKKAEDIAILDMRKVVNFCDYFLICTGNSERHVRALVDGLETELSQGQIKVGFKQGLRDNRWALLDLGSVVVHVFDREARGFYNLEHLWQDAKRIPWKE